VEQPARTAVDELRRMLGVLRDRGATDATTGYGLRALLAGKVLGNGALALAQVVLIGLVSVVSMRAVDAGAILAQLGCVDRLVHPFLSPAGNRSWRWSSFSARRCSS
jgi:hypothetical protein